MSSSLGAVAASTSASPSMIGDFFGGGYQYLVASPANGATVAVAGGDRVLKFSDNNSPIPQNRLFFNYHLFNNSVVDVNGQTQNTNRFTFGLEKTVWDGTASIEFRVPFEASVDATQMVGSNDTLAAEFGNLALATKLLIYLGVYCRPNNRVFTQFVTQVNFDVSGSTVTVFDPSFFGGVGSDRIFEQSLLFLDYSLGYWMYHVRSDDWITGIAPMVELHYTSTLNDLDLPDISGAYVFEEDLRRDALNLTGGVLFELGPQTYLRLAGVAPLRHNSLIYDAEFGLQLIRRY